MPKGLLVRLHPVQNLVFICRAKQPHCLRRMRGFGLSAHLVWGCGGAYWVGYWFSVSPRSSFIVCLTRRAVVTSR